MLCADKIILGNERLCTKVLALNGAVEKGSHNTFSRPNTKLSFIKAIAKANVSKPSLKKIFYFRMDRLTGQALLAKLNELQDAKLSEKAYQTGYTRITEDGSIKSDFAGFYEAVADAKAKAKEPEDIKPIVDLDNKTESGEDQVENNKFWEEQSDWNVANMIINGDGLIPPIHLIPKFARSEDSDLRECIAELLETPKEILTHLSEDEDYRVRAAAALSIARLKTGILVKKEDFLEQLETLEIKDELAMELFFLDNEDIKFSLTRNQKISEACIEKLLENDLAEMIEIRLLQSLAKRRLPPEYDLEDESAIVKTVSNGFPDEKILENLVLFFLDSDSYDPSQNLCRFLAKSRNTPEQIFKILVSKGDSFVRREIAGNQSAPLECLKILASDEEDNVRLSLAKNPSAPKEILKLLSKDSSKFVKSEASLCLLPLQWQGLSNEELLEKLRSSLLPEEIALSFAYQGKPDNLLALAENPFLTKTVMLELSECFDSRVIEALVKNQSTAQDIIKQIQKCWIDDPLVKQALLVRSLLISGPADKEPSVSDINDMVAQGLVAKPKLSKLFCASDLDTCEAIIESNVFSDVEMKELVDQRNAIYYESDLENDQIFSGSDQKGWIIVACSTIVWNTEENVLYDDSESDLWSNSFKLARLTGRSGSCRTAQFIWEGSSQCSGLFYVVDPYGDCCESLVSDVERSARRAQVYTNIKEALGSEYLADCGRVLSCIAISYEENDLFVEVEDFSKEESVNDGELYSNFPTVSKQFEEGLEIYFKAHPAHGDASIVHRLCWEQGELTEEDEFECQLSEELSAITVGNPFLFTTIG